MALSANTVWELRTGGADTNGGGFVTGASGTDHSQQDAAQYSVTDGVTAGTTTITSATANFGTDVVGNIIYVQGGTGSVAANWYQITARTDASTITVDRSTGLTAGTGVTLKIGGALATPGGLGAVLTAVAVSGMRAWIKAGTYTLSSSTPNVSGGPLSTPASAVSLMISGYNATRGDLDAVTLITNKPVIDAGSIGSITMFDGNSSSNPGSVVSSLVFDGNKSAASTVVGVDIDNRWTAVNCHVRDCDGIGFDGSGTAMGCEAMGNNSHGFDIASRDCSAHHNGGNGFNRGNDAELVNALSYRNTGDGAVMGVRANCKSCTFAFNGGDGLDAGAGSCHAIDVIAYGNGAFGIRDCEVLINCATGSNTSGRSTNNLFDLSPLLLTSDPFEDSDADDYRLNNTAGGGAELRGAALAHPCQQAS